MQNTSGSSSNIPPPPPRTSSVILSDISWHHDVSHCCWWRRAADVGHTTHSPFAAEPVLQNYIIYLRLPAHPTQYCFNPRSPTRLIAEQHQQPYVGRASKLQVMSWCQMCGAPAQCCREEAGPSTSTAARRCSVIYILTVMRPGQVQVWKFCISKHLDIYGNTAIIGNCMLCLYIPR